MNTLKCSAVALAVALVGCSKKPQEAASFPPPAPALKANMPTGQFSATAVAELEKAKAQSKDAREMAVADLIILSHYASPGTKMQPAELRAKFEALASAHPDTWISIQCKTGIVETYSPSENYKQRIEMLQSILTDGGLEELANPADPYLKIFMAEGEGTEVSKAPRDFILAMLVYNYAAGFDVETAEKTVAEIKSSYWKTMAQRHLDEAKKTPTDILQKRREYFLKNQK